MSPKQEWWKCATCGKSWDASAGVICATCGSQAPLPAQAPPVRASLASYSGVLDTKSFVLPVRRKAIWLWVAIGVGLPLLMSGVYMVIKALLR